ncbi:hypothetical protein [Halomonas citrativorans]|uniref:Uncharacterized protein n=1 Tax=Halomonas citrativorans TaxID=2742612 RepID=A0ABR9FFK2_9GAMM|nr:hypothetical protein [Halomonas citrativorans]MBE0405176.1 hypothetical protein [Halomonas citrativorans]
MQAIIDIGDQKTGSKTRQVFIKNNKEELSRHGIGILRSTKVVDYDMGLGAYAGNKEYERIYRNVNNLSEDIRYEKYLEDAVRDEISGERFDKYLFSFEGLMHLDVRGVEKLTSMLYRYFSEIKIIGFLRRQDRKAVSDYTTRLRNAGATDLDVLYYRDGSPRGTDYYKSYNSWCRFVPEENVSFINYDECSDVARELVFHAKLSGSYVFKNERHNKSLSAFGSEVLRGFNKKLAGLDKYKDKVESTRAAIKDYYVGQPLKPAKHEAKKLFKDYQESNRKLAEKLEAKRKYYFDEDFSEYPDDFSPINIEEHDLELYIEKALRGR